jgi:hypothetical protein
MNTESTTQLRVVEQLPAAETLARHGASALELVEAFVVNDDATYQLAGEELQAIQRREKALNDQRMAITRPIDEAKSQVMNLFRGPVETLGKAAGILKAKMLGYSQQVAQRAAEERAQAERLAQQERDRLAAEAAALRAAGNAGEAEVKEQVATMIVAAPAAQPEAPKVAGVSERKTVDFEIVDLHALVKHVAQHPELVGLLTFDSVKLRAHVKSMGMACTTPGLRVFEKSSLAASRK